MSNKPSRSEIWFFGGVFLVFLVLLGAAIAFIVIECAFFPPCGGRG